MCCWPVCWKKNFSFVVFHSLRAIIWIENREKDGFTFFISSFPFIFFFLKFYFNSFYCHLHVFFFEMDSKVIPMVDLRVFFLFFSQFRQDELKIEYKLYLWHICIFKLDLISVVFGVHFNYTNQKDNFILQTLSGYFVYCRKL